MRFAKERQIYSKDSTPIAKLLLGSLRSVAESECFTIREHQTARSVRVKEHGGYEERKKALTAERVEQAKKWINEGIPKAEVARRLKIGRTTLYKYVIDHQNKA